MICQRCGQNDDCRLGFCWDCADAGEARAAARTVAQHVAKGISHVARGYWFDATLYGVTQASVSQIVRGVAWKGAGA